MCHFIAYNCPFGTLFLHSLAVSSQSLTTLLAVHAAAIRLIGSLEFTIAIAAVNHLRQQA